MVVRADLNGHLKALKDYFLLAKGDFFQVSMTYGFSFPLHARFSIVALRSLYRFCAKLLFGLFSDTSDHASHLVFS